MATFNSFQVDVGPFYTSNVILIWTSDDTQVSLAFVGEPLAVVWGISDDPPDTHFYSEPYHHDGYLMPSETSSPRFIMRAFKTTPTTGHVYWEVEELDLTGQFSGYLPSELTDIVIYHECCTRNDDKADT